jgi:hypothetical protein
LPSLDHQFHIQRYNPTWGDFAARYAPARVISAGATVWKFRKHFKE